MDEEHEMCQNCKKDIPIGGYRTHTLHCARNMVKCRDCETMVGRQDMQIHQLEFHTLRICSQCRVNVEAFKLPEHKKTLCSKRKLKCKFCNLEQLASNMTDHENHCGCKEEQCDKCFDWILLRDWDSHQSRYHCNIVRRFRERSVIATNCAEEDQVATRATLAAAASSTTNDDDPMLPCEFCEGMIPMRKLLEHQAECVNPTNIRRSESISNLSQMSVLPSQSSYRPLSGLRYSHSSLKRSPPSVMRKFSAPSTVASEQPAMNNDTVPCEFCDEQQSIENVMMHQRTCERNPTSVADTSYDSSSLRRTAVRNLSLSRASSVREARATTEDRSLGLSLSRQSSFSERSYSSRRTDSIYTRGTLGLSRFTCGSDYAAAARRSALFDGYTGFALYSSISQGLDDITYGGRRSRRNSVTDSNYSYSRRGSLSGTVSSTINVAPYHSANGGSPYSSLSRQDSAYESSPSVSSAHLPAGQKNVAPASALVTAPANATANATATTIATGTAAAIATGTVAAAATATAAAMAAAGVTIAPSKTLSREDSAKWSPIKLERKVSFSGADPVVVADDESTCPQKPSRTKDKGADKKKRATKTDGPKTCHDLFSEVSAKLKVLEQEQGGGTDQEVSSLDASPVPQSPLSIVPPTSLFPLREVAKKEPEVKAGPTTTVSVSATVTLSPAGVVSVSRNPSEPHPHPAKESKVSAFILGDSKSAAVGRNDCNNNNQLTANLNNNMMNMTSVSGSGSLTGSGWGSGNEPVMMREKSHQNIGKESKPGSKRNSLDNKTVQTLAQDLAAECAKAYALMESSLSKLSTDFAVGPFGLTPKNKKSRKSRAPSSSAPLK